MFFNPGSGEVQFAGRQRFADEDFARLGRMALRIVDAPPVVDQQPPESERKKLYWSYTILRIKR